MSLLGNCGGRITLFLLRALCRFLTGIFSIHVGIRVVRHTFPFRVNQRLVVLEYPTFLSQGQSTIRSNFLVFGTKCVAYYASGADGGITIHSLVVLYTHRALETQFLILERNFSRWNLSTSTVISPVQ